MNSIVRQITLFSALTMETLGDVHEQFEMGSPHELYSVILEHTVCVYERIGLALIPLLACTGIYQYLIVP